MITIRKPVSARFGLIWP